MCHPTPYSVVLLGGMPLVCWQACHLNTNPSPKLYSLRIVSISSNPVISTSSVGLKEDKCVSLSHNLKIAKGVADANITEENQGKVGQVSQRQGGGMASPHLS